MENKLLEKLILRAEELNKEHFLNNGRSSLPVVMTEPNVYYNIQFVLEALIEHLDQEYDKQL